MVVGGQRHAPAAIPPGKVRYPLYRRLGGPQGRSGRVRKISPPTGIRFPDRGARSESLYRLSYPGPQFTVVVQAIICRFVIAETRVQSVGGVRYVVSMFGFEDFCLSLPSLLHHTHTYHVDAFGVTVPRVCLTHLLKSRISRYYHVCHLLQYNSRYSLNSVSKGRVDE